MLRAGNALLRTGRNPLYAIGIPALLFLFGTVLVPLWDIVRYTLTWQTGDRRLNAHAVPGDWTLYHWVHVLASDISRSVLYKPLLHSVSIAATVSACSLLIGGLLAWLVTRTDLPGKKWLGLLAVIPYMVPSWIKSFAWLVLFKNDKIGGSPGLLQALFGHGPPDGWSYGFLPISVILTEHSYMYFYLLIAVALGAINGSLEESADILGAGRWTVLRRITFPLIAPAVLSGLILTFSSSMGSFGVAALLGLPVKYYTVSTMLYNSMNSRMTSVGYVLGILLILFSALLIYFNQRALGARRSYAVIGGKDARGSVVPLGRWRVPAAACAFLFLFASGIVPLLLLVWQSFMLQDGNFSWSNLTLHYWIGASDPHIANGLAGILRSPLVWQGLKNSFQVALIAAAAASLLGLLIGYVVAKGRGSLLSRAVEQMSFLPYLIPGISMSAIYLAMFAQPHLLLPSLYGTLAIVVLISVVNELPFAARSGTSTVYQISGELEEAAVIQGASWFRRFARIIMPIGRKGLLSAFLISFIGVMKEMDLIILLVTPKTSTLTTLTFSYTEKGYQ